jgi:hypothetical protein
MGDFMKKARGPADNDKKLGMVNSATVTNCTKVIRGPAAGSSLHKNHASVLNFCRLTSGLFSLDDRLERKDL